jgi:hypothetical protein
MPDMYTMQQKVLGIVRKHFWLAKGNKPRYFIILLKAPLVKYMDFGEYNIRLTE